MTTRAHAEWFVIHDPRGGFVARADSPASRQARRDGATVYRYATLGGAFTRRSVTIRRTCARPPLHPLAP